MPDPRVPVIAATRIALQCTERSRGGRSGMPDVADLSLHWLHCNQHSTQLNSTSQTAVLEQVVTPNEGWAAAMYSVEWVR